VPIERLFAIAMIIVAFMHNKFRIVRSPTNKWVFSLLALQFILSPFAYNTGYAVDQGIEYAKMVILYMLMLSVVDDEATLKVLVKAYVFTMMFYALHSLLEYHNGRMMWRMGISRMMGVDETMGDPNAFAASIILSLPMVYCLLRFETRRLMRRLYYCYYILAVICVVLTGSRSAFVGMLLILSIWVAAQKGKRKLLMMVTAVLLCAVLWSVMPQEKQERIRSLWDDDAGPANAHESAEGRLEGFKVSCKMFKQRPFTGVGAGGKNFIGYRMTHNIDEEGHESPTQAHNLYGEVLAELGTGGVLLLLGYIISILRCSVVARGNLNSLGAKDTFQYSLGGAIITCVLILLFLGLGGHNFYRPMWLWLAAWSGTLFRISGWNLQQVLNQTKLDEVNVFRRSDIKGKSA
jgi:O-antigen ligase